jgi:hypothetical protein
LDRVQQPDDESIDELQEALKTQRHMTLKNPHFFQCASSIEEESKSQASSPSPAKAKSQTSLDQELLSTPNGAGAHTRPFNIDTVQIKSSSGDSAELMPIMSILIKDEETPGESDIVYRTQERKPAVVSEFSHVIMESYERKNSADDADPFNPIDTD